MKKILSIILVSASILLLSFLPHQSYSASIEDKKRNNKGELLHIVKEDESVSEIAKNYGVPLQDLLTKNNIKNSTVEQGDVLVLPETLSSQEKDLLARLVHAEAKGEPYKGKVAVATVVLNRVDSDKFPDTVSEVIHAKNQFTPVSNGSIKKPADKESMKATKEAIAMQDKGLDATFFYNPKKTNDRWIKSLPVVSKIGNHHFAVS